jgi:vesicle transport protein SEC22
MEYKNQAKMLFKRLNAEESRCSVESGPYIFQYVFVNRMRQCTARCTKRCNHCRCSYMIEFGVCYLTVCDKTYPKRLAFSYLEELQKEFNEKFGHEVDTAARPYAFVKFGKTEAKRVEGQGRDGKRRTTDIQSCPR